MFSWNDMKRIYTDLSKKYIWKGQILDFLIGVIPFLPGEINKKENWFLTEQDDGNIWHIFPILKYSEHLAQFFKVIFWGYFYVVPKSE